MQPVPEQPVSPDARAILTALHDAATTERMLSKASVMAMTDLGQTELWRALERGEFPAPRLRTANRLGWLQSEVQAWIRSRPVAPKFATPNPLAQ